MGLCSLVCFKPFYLLILVRKIFGEENASWLHEGFKASIHSPVSPEASVYSKKAVGWKALRPATGILTSPLPLSFLWEDGEERALVFTHTQEQTPWRQTWGADSADWTTGGCTGEQPGRGPSDNRFAILSSLEEAITWPSTGSLAQDTFKCTYNENRCNQDNAGLFDCVTEALSKDTMEGLWSFNF